MKKSNSIFGLIAVIGFIIAIFIAPIQAKAESAVYGDYEYTENSADKTISIIKYNGADDIVEIPQKINGIQVKSIGERAFEGNDSITKLVIPEGVTSIAASAFSCCRKLKYVTFPNSLEEIGFIAFYNCESLESIYIPEMVKTIANEAFSGCGEVKKIQVASNNKIFDSRNNCNAIVITSKDELIVGCENTTFESGLKTIGQYAFKNVSGLRVIDIPSSVTCIDEGAFFGCDNIEDVTLPEKLQKIGESAFYNCSKLSNIELPDGIIEIGSYAFSFCTKLKSIYIPASVEKMGSMILGYHGDDLVIKCYRWSLAYKYAQDFSIKYEILEVPKTDISKAVIQGIENKIYNGNPQTQKNITVVLNGIQLQEGRDYVLSYESNTNPGKAKIIISGIEDYAGIIEQYFLIKKQVVDISKINDIDIVGIPTYVIYSGKEITLKNIQVMIGDSILKEETDYIVTYNNNINVGKASIVIKGNGDYSGIVKKTFLIKSKDISIKESGISVIGLPDADIYSGKLCVYPNLIVKCDNTIMTVGRDYDIRYFNNRNVGVAKVIITGKGNYSGNITKKFVIRIQAGKVYNIGYLKYRITNSALNGKGTVSLVGTTLGKGSKKLAKLIIPDNVTIGGVRFSVVSIGDSAFRGYANLKNVFIGSKVKSIGKKAFYGCRNLNRITIGKNVQVINERALAGCNKLKQITIKTTKLTINSVRVGAFKSIYSKVAIKVPGSKVKNYKKILVLRGISGSARITK